MTNEDIIRMAREAGLYSGSPRTPSTGRMIEKRLERFAALVAAAEREACAKVAEQWPYEDERMFSIAQAIRIDLLYNFDQSIESSGRFVGHKVRVTKNYNGPRNISN